MTNESQTEATEAVDEAVESPESLVDRYKALVVAENDPQAGIADADGCLCHGTFGFL